MFIEQVMFHDIKPRQSQAVVVNGHKLFKCMDSVDYIDTDLPSGSNQAKYKTCAMTGQCLCVFLCAVCMSVFCGSVNLSY